MELLLLEQVTDPNHLTQLERMLAAADQEFIPPLSSRSSTTQGTLSGGETASDGVRAYFDAMKDQAMVLAMDGDRLAGFMAFRFDLTNDLIGPETLPNIYATTSVVSPDYRGQGLMEKMYRTMIGGYPQRAVYARTWSGNLSHLKIAARLGFIHLKVLKDHRGPGIDTVYLERKPGPFAE